jgi:hypothetical protein
MTWKVRPKTRKAAGKMNKWEAAFAERLEMFRLEGSIIDWKYESIRFRLAANTTYTPDFFLITKDAIEFIEIKGQRHSTGMAKFKIAAEMYPWAVWKMVEKTKLGWKTIMDIE